jgi:hypothetical protein
MSIRLTREDNFSIVTTAICEAPWGVFRAQVQIKTYNGDLELATDNVVYLDLLVGALKQLRRDTEDESLRYEQIRSRVFNSTEHIPGKKFAK